MAEPTDTDKLVAATLAAAIISKPEKIENRSPANGAVKIYRQVLEELHKPTTSKPD